MFCVTSWRVRILAAHKWSTNNTPRGERRGGARIKPGYAELKEEIKRHIGSFRCVTSNYGEDKTPHKEYLPSNLSVKKMFCLFKENYKGPVDVQYKYYHGIFVNCFNLGFGDPSKDIDYFCSTQTI